MMPDAGAALASDDPTGTKTKRDSAKSTLHGRWRRVRGEIRRLLENTDSLHPDASTRDAAQIADFEDALEAAIDEEVIQPIAAAEVRRGRHYSAPWIRESYKHGIDLADAHLDRAGYDVPDTDSDTAIRQDAHQNGLERQYQTTFDDLAAAGRDAYEDASRRYSTALASGLVSVSKLIRNAASSGPDEDGINQRLDKIGKTGTDRALDWHLVESVNDAALTRYERAGVEALEGAIETETRIELDGVDVTDAEFKKDLQTAGDARVCSDCRMLAAGGPYTIEEIRTDPNLKPPIHDRCRCLLIAVPLERL